MLIWLLPCSMGVACPAALLRFEERSESIVRLQNWRLSVRWPLRNPPISVTIKIPIQVLGAPGPYGAAGGSPAKSLHVRPLGLYVRPPRQNFRRRGPARQRNHDFALRRFHVGRPGAARSGRPGPPICSRGLRYRPHDWCECEKNRLHAYIFMGRGASARFRRRAQIGRFLRRSGASGRLLGTRGRARGGSIAPNAIFAGVPRATS